LVFRNLDNDYYIINIIATILETEKPLYLQYRNIFNLIEFWSVMIFTAEYLLRVWSIVEKTKFKNPITGRIKYLVTPLSLIDLLAILPFYIHVFFLDLRALRIIRLFRLFRLFKIVRYLKAMKIIFDVLKEKKEPLIISIIFIFFLLLFSSCIMYYVENHAQPDKFSSILETMWWGATTLTSVGYGDVYPITPLGKLLGGTMAVLGLGLFAIPTGILASGFTENLLKKKKDIE
jgi:voltage-gated potassium channel